MNEQTKKQSLYFAVEEFVETFWERGYSITAMLMPGDAFDALVRDIPIEIALRTSSLHEADNLSLCFNGEWIEVRVAEEAAAKDAEASDEKP